MKSVHLVILIVLIYGSSFAQPNQAQTGYYVFPEFTEGIVLKKNGIQHNELLNYCSLTEEMIFESDGIKLAITEEEVSHIDTVFIKESKFIVLNGKFVEYFGLSNAELYVEYGCDVKEKGRPTAYGGTSETTSISQWNTYVSNLNHYELKVPDNLELDPYFYYWLNKNGEINRFKSLVQLKRLYKDKKDLYKEYVRNNAVKYDNRQSIIGLIDYLESN